MRKSYLSLTYIFLSKEIELRNMRLQQIRRWPPGWKPFLSACCFQFEPTKALQPDPSSGENWETCSSEDSEPSVTRQNEASVDTWCPCFNCSQINNEGVLVLS